VKWRFFRVDPINHVVEKYTRTHEEDHIFQKPLLLMTLLLLPNGCFPSGAHPTSPGGAGAAAVSNSKVPPSED